MRWIPEKHGWVTTPEDILGALTKDGFEECKRETTTSRRDTRPAGGVWQGVNRGTGCVASAIWVNHAAWPQVIAFITINGEWITGAGAGEDDPYRDDGGEG
jgi:hypothetical protein